MKRLFLLATLTVMSGISYAGGWPQSKGKGYFKLGQYVLHSDSYFNPEGNKIRVNPGISVYTSSLYAEYGLSERLTVIGYVPFFTTTILNALQKRNGDFIEGDKLSSMGDMDFGLKYGLIQDKAIVLSAQLTLGLPIGNPLGGETESLQTGDGEFNQMLTIEASHSFYPKPLYVSSSLGFNNRTEGFSDEFRFGLEAGFTFKKLTLIGKVSGVQSFQNGETNPNSTQGVFGNNIEYLIVSPELVYSFNEKFGLSGNTGIALSGRQVLASPSYSAGLFWKF